MHYELEPEVAGGWGEGTVADTSVHPPKVVTLNYEFSDWLGDELLETFPCFIVSDRVALALDNSRLSGFSFASVTITRSPEFQSNSTLPCFRWLKVTGGVEDDFYLNHQHLLVVSERALEILRQGQLANCAVRRC